MPHDDAPDNQPARRVTLSDVAADAGVSRATASLVLRGSPLVSDRTREHVRASMQKLGYVYNRAAASLRAQRSHTVGLAVTDITNPFFAELAVGIEAHLDEARYTVLLTNTAEKLDKQDRLLATMHGYQIDGLLLCPARGTTLESLEHLRQWGLPFVLITRYLPGSEVDYVGPDNVAGAAMAVEHLLDLGHRHIAFVGGPPDSSARHDRLTGYRHALAGHGLTPDETLSLTSPVTREGGYAAMQTLLARPDPPTAALCYNDVVAFGAMLALQAAGLTPGHDVSIVGFDNIADSALWQPALTTVSITPHQIAEEAVHLLLNRIAHPNEDARQIVLPPELIVRDSSGPPPAEG